MNERLCEWPDCGRLAGRGWDVHGKSYCGPHYFPGLEKAFLEAYAAWDGYASRLTNSRICSVGMSSVSTPWAASRKDFPRAGLKCGRPRGRKPRSGWSFLSSVT